MTENMRKFVEAVQKSEETEGFNAEAEGDGELSLDDLDAAAGGKLERQVC